MLELAKLYLTTEDLDQCQHQCMTLLKNDTENDSATVVGYLTCAIFKLLLGFNNGEY